jgi:hypothetical protein
MLPHKHSFGSVENVASIEKTPHTTRSGLSSKGTSRNEFLAEFFETVDSVSDEGMVFISTLTQPSSVRGLGQVWIRWVFISSVINYGLEGYVSIIYIVNVSVKRCHCLDRGI